MQLEQSEFADRIEEAARSAFEGKRVTEIIKRSGFGDATEMVKRTFGDLGRTLGNKIAAAGYPDADEREWLYDMVWYTEDADGFLAEQPLVLESELKPGGSVHNAADVDGDFQKLVQARANVRVWVSTCPNEDMTQRHIANCKNQARRFKGKALGDTYIFVVGDWTTDHFVIERFETE